MKLTREQYLQKLALFTLARKHTREQDELMEELKEGLEVEGVGSHLEDNTYNRLEEDDERVFKNSLELDKIEYEEGG